jgi:hypothetical protein
MNVSSLAARDSTYVALPATGTYFDAADRSRYLRGLRVRFGDVEGEGGMGRLAIRKLDGALQMLTRGGIYI